MVSEERLVAGEGNAEFALSGKECMFGSKEAGSNLSKSPPVGDTVPAPKSPVALIVVRRLRRFFVLVCAIRRMVLLFSVGYVLGVVFVFLRSPYKKVQSGH